MAERKGPSKSVSSFHVMTTLIILQLHVFVLACSGAYVRVHALCSAVVCVCACVAFCCIVRVRVCE